MSNLLGILYDWVEVWALFISLIAYFSRRPKYNWVTPIFLYLVVALLLNITIDTIWYGNRYKIFELNNNIFYNIHSFIRFFLFAWFFHFVGKPFPRLNRFAPYLFVGVAIIVYAFVDKNIFRVSSKMLALESALLLGYCIVFFLKLIQEDQTVSPAKLPTFWIVGGLSLFIAVNFFTYLFLNYLAVNNKEFLVVIWHIHNFFYLVMCIFIAIAFRK